jgi:tRNA U38,U39,U40 pseudouridine synthase TruA
MILCVYCLTSNYFYAINNNSNYSDVEKKKYYHWSLAAVDLALIPSSLLESIQTEVMDTYTSECRGAQEFNDYMVENYVYQETSRFSLNIWNVHDNTRRKLPRTNNAITRYNFRIYLPSFLNICIFTASVADSKKNINISTINRRRVKFK